MPYDTTLDAMKALAGRIAGITGDCKEYGHPLDLNHVLETRYRDIDAILREYGVPRVDRRAGQ